MGEHFTFHNKWLPSSKLALLPPLPKWTWTKSNNWRVTNLSKVFLCTELKAAHRESGGVYTIDIVANLWHLFKPLKDISCKMLHRILYLGEMVWCRIYGPRVFGVFQCKMICLKIAPKHLNTTVPLSDHTKFSSPLPVWFFSADDLIFLEFHLVHAFLHSD